MYRGYKRPFNEEVSLSYLSPNPSPSPEAPLPSVFYQKSVHIQMCFIKGNSSKLFTLFYSLLFSLFFIWRICVNIYRAAFSFLQLYNIPLNHLLGNFILHIFTNKKKRKKGNPKQYNVCKTCT